MQLLTQHSVDDLLAMARQQRAGAEERARDLGEVIVTLEQLASSESLLQRLTIPGPRPPGVDTSPVPAAERRQADETVLQPPHAPDPAGQRALALAVRAGQTLVAYDTAEDSRPPQPPAAPSTPAASSDVPGGPVQGTQRQRVLAAMRQSPKQMWSAMELCDAIGVPSHRRLRIALNNMVARGELVKHKEPGRKSVHYQLAPGTQEAVPGSG